MRRSFSEVTVNVHIWTNSRSGRGHNVYQQPVQPRVADFLQLSFIGTYKLTIFADDFFHNMKDGEPQVKKKLLFPYLLRLK
jgi:hypothetical protein